MSGAIACASTLMELALDFPMLTSSAEARGFGSSTTSSLESSSKSSELTAVDSLLRWSAAVSVAAVVAEEEAPEESSELVRMAEEE